MDLIEKYLGESENEPKIDKKWMKKHYKGELYDKKTGDYIGNIYWEGKDNLAYVLSVEYGKVKKIIGKYNPTKFKQAGKLKVSQAQSVQKWEF